MKRQHTEEAEAPPDREENGSRRRRVNDDDERRNPHHRPQTQVPATASATAKRNRPLRQPTAAARPRSTRSQRRQRRVSRLCYTSRVSSQSRTRVKLNRVFFPRRSFQARSLGCGRRRHSPNITGGTAATYPTGGPNRPVLERTGHEYTTGTGAYPRQRPSSARKMVAKSPRKLVALGTPYKCDPGTRTPPDTTGPRPQDATGINGNPWDRHAPAGETQHRQEMAAICSRKLVVRLPNTVRPEHAPTPDNTRTQPQDATGTTRATARQRTEPAGPARIQPTGHARTPKFCCRGEPSLATVSRDGRVK
ncbi:unnamed protein product [Acanthosepion pharaonis]|uniref:Uncharacterized protein n=1 Tax=Acanthosepion pharaonis TaxID=158019 RepID=A0A812B9I4_ACAPH|nr:unnamed protein product [Sepia pharaonis]